MVALTTKGGSPLRVGTKVPEQFGLVLAGRGDALPGASVVNSTEVPGYLPNPGIGYTNPWGVDGRTPTINYKRGVDFGYDWATMNPTEGVYNWATLDADLAAAATAGRQAAFRIYTMPAAAGPPCVPAWALAKGVVILPEGMPDYRNTVYLREYCRFVDALAARYDGDPRISFIDMASYGNYSEWGITYPFAVNEPTSWDAPTGLDFMARRHLIEAYCGGARTQSALNPDGVTIDAVTYSHIGFQSTQLMMNYGGFFENTQYVLDRFPRVGLRNDFFGVQPMSSFVSMGHGAVGKWRTAPVGFETATSPDRTYVQMLDLVKQMGGSWLNDINNFHLDQPAADYEALISALGYRYLCTKARFRPALASGGLTMIETTWTNTGAAKSYPPMGQDFQVVAALLNGATVAASWNLGRTVADWLPGASHLFLDYLRLPALAAGPYKLGVGIANRRDGKRLLLPMPGAVSGYYPVGDLTIT